MKSLKITQNGGMYQYLFFLGGGEKTFYLI